MAGLVYILCAATCLLCAVLLLRGYAKQRVRLLLWSGLCFLGLTGENVLQYVDLITGPDLDLSIWRKLPGLAALVVLLIGLVWDSK
jgi:hypothetical protein